MPKTQPSKSTGRGQTSGVGRPKRNALISAVNKLGYNGEQFCQSLYMAVNVFKLKRGKSDKKIRFYYYACWANQLKKNGIDVPEGKCGFAFPAEVLDFIREVLPKDVVGEIRPDAFPITLDTFCRYFA